MNIYEFYEQVTGNNPEKFEEPDKQKLREEIKTLFKNSLKDVYDWAIRITSMENMPTEVSEFVKKNIHNQILIDPNCNHVFLYTDRWIPYTDFKTSELFESNNYSEFKKKTQCCFSIALYPDSRDFINLGIADYNSLGFELLEQKILLKILQDLEWRGDRNIEEDNQSYVKKIINIRKLFDNANS